MVSRNAIVVSDDAQIKSMLCRILGPKQWTIEGAADNLAALRLVEARKFDLILTSEKTSGKEDIEFLRKIRGMHPHTRVIILTDETTQADVIAAIRENAFSYFSKPISLSLLASIVEHAI